jgi:hypothetical protein
LERRADRTRQQQNITHVAAVSAAVASVVTLIIVATRKPTTTIVERYSTSSTAPAEPMPRGSFEESDDTSPALSPGASEPDAEDAGPVAAFGATDMLSEWALPDATRAATRCDEGSLPDCRNFATMAIHGLNGQGQDLEAGCNLLQRLCGFSDSLSCALIQDQCGPLAIVPAE